MTKSTKIKREDGPRNEQRRRFMETTAKFGVTAALVVGAAGALTSSEAAAQTAKEEKARQSDAKWTMTIGTAYRIGTTRSYPIMQLNFKENIQNLTRGQVYVKLTPAGQLGVGTKLAEKVQSGTIQAAQHSLSNFAPFASAVDLINLPYWCGENQKFVNLVTSAVWEQEVNSRVKAKGFKPLFYFCIDPRTAAKRRGLGDEPFRTPQDLQGIKFRVPGSKILQQFYRLLGANPTPVAWGETPSAIKQGVADALDPAVEALYAFGFKDILSWVTFNRSVPDSQVYSCNLEWFEGLPADVYRLLGANPTPVAWGETPSAIKQGVADALDPAVEALYAFGFKDILSWVTFNRSVPDSQVYSCNLEWFEGLPADVREGIDFASEVTFQQNLAQVPASRAFAMAEMGKAGVQFYVPTADELGQWMEAAGHQRKEWDEWKVELGGSKANFDKLLAAANTQGKYFVHDV